MVVPLADAPRLAGQVGGKALHLGQLAAAGLPVPAGFVVPVARFEEHLWRTGLMSLAERVARDPSAGASLRRALLEGAVEPALAAQLVAGARALGPSVAVRSSGIGEDGGERSFAGQHDSVLGARPEDVPRALLGCWASLYEERALAYRGERGPAPGALAVLVQQMVDPECAGVLFTINPATGSWREMVVEAVWGLGEGLVSGQIPPQFFLVRRPRRVPVPLGRVAARVTLQVVEEDHPEQAEWFVVRGAQLAREPTPAGLRSRPTLDRSALRALCRLGLDAERTFSEPVDVEWARDRGGRLHLLQARPITTHATPRPRNSVLWTRRFVGERFPAPATPLGWSILEPVLTWLVAYPATQERLLGGGPPFKLVHGRPYVNATVFRHLAFKLPGAPPPRFMLELVPPDEERAWRRRFAVAPDLGVYASIFRTTFDERRWRRFQWNPFTNHREWDKLEEQLRLALPDLRRAPATAEEAVQLVERHVRWIRDYAGLHICSLLFANISFQLLEAALSAWVPERRTELHEALAHCPPGNLTLETNAALHALARRATDADLAALASGAPPSPEFAAALAPFLARFGHRSEASWEMMSPRWGRHPERLVPLLVAQRGAEAEDPTARADRQEQRYEAAMAELRDTLSGPRLALVELAVHYARRYLLLRENQRFWFDHLMASLQDALLGLGDRGVRAGWLPHRDDVALLTWPELRAAVVGGDRPAPGLVEQRRAQRADDDRADPPTFLVGDDPGPPDRGARRLQGLGISSGRARGRVRVVRSVDEGHLLQPGEILVTRAVDPGWTPLFLTAAGVVLEMGSLLSHGAVVAREYGLPAVVNIDRATQRLSTGQEVTVDGSRGLVWVHSPAVGAAAEGA